MKTDTPKRRQIAPKTGYKCHWCGKGLRGGNWTADHVRPKANGGKNTVDNLLPACSFCNRYRWLYDTRTLRYILQLGVYMSREVDKRTSLGRDVEKRYKSRVRNKKKNKESYHKNKK